MLVDRMNAAMLKSLIETVPLEITVIDANDEVVGWNQHDKRLFHRPWSSMGLNFRNCHPEKSLHMVEQIVAEMKAGSRDKARFWIDLTVPTMRKRNTRSSSSSSRCATTPASTSAVWSVRRTSRTRATSKARKPC